VFAWSASKKIVPFSSLSKLKTCMNDLSNIDVSKSFINEAKILENENL